MKTRLQHLAPIALIAVTAPACAVTTVYTSSATFLPNVAAGAYTNTFTGPAVNAAAGTYSFAQGGFGYTVTGPGPIGPGTFTNGSVIGNNYPNLSLTISFTSGNVTAIGGEFFITNAAVVFQPSAVSITLSDGTSTAFTPSSMGNAYRGFVSTVPITSLTLAAPGANLHNMLDNLTVGVAAPVPEPAGWLLMALGLNALLAARGGARQAALF